MATVTFNHNYDVMTLLVTSCRGTIIGRFEIEMARLLSKYMYHCSFLKCYKIEGTFSDLPRFLGLPQKLVHLTNVEYDKQAIFVPVV